ncbi:hypothetical protein GMRT_11982 [Giardia muris]|uniref:Uncharacterized protein n=1 Tax=Giardia muris TaxID=5742 RepID=A0A4Z1SP60_GIAMU|nr:hypothetical protein GMRT_11982 [Giardia muris]|eukprot:TNJ27614.1 hypothetical protein GMRT_11982 [Giardia muris]
MSAAFRVLTALCDRRAAYIRPESVDLVVELLLDGGGVPVPSASAAQYVQAVARDILEALAGEPAVPAGGSTGVGAARAVEATMTRSALNSSAVPPPPPPSVADKQQFAVQQYMARMSRAKAQRAGATRAERMNGAAQLSRRREVEARRVGQPTLPTMGPGSAHGRQHEARDRSAEATVTRVEGGSS